jgi:uncharacterized membrane protein YraQ (UPF0718 family)
MSLFIVTGLLVLISLVANRKKTLMAFKIAGKKFLKVLPDFLLMLIMVSVILYLVPDRVILDYLGNNNTTLSVVAASLLGSVALMPGFIAFPVCGLLLQKGVSYMVLAAFSTTLMMVGIATFPLEKEYFGIKVAIIRNVIGFIIALITAVVIGICLDGIWL